MIFHPYSCALLLFLLWNSVTTCVSQNISTTLEEVEDVATITTTEQIITTESTTSKEQEIDNADTEYDDFKRLKDKKVIVVEKDWEQLGWLQLPQEYSKEQVPSSHNSHNNKSPLTVYIFINIRSINAIDMRNEKITLDLDLYEFWADKRFHQNHTQHSNETMNNHLVVEVQKLHPDFLRTIWLPDLIIENTILVPHNDLTSKPIVSFNTETGFVKYSRLEVTSPCSMSFFYYPLDTQRCEINIRSYKHTSENLDLHWAHSGVYLGAGNNNYDVKVDSATKQKRISKTVNFPNLLGKLHLKNIVLADISFDVLKIVLNFRRNVSYHFVQTYLPSAFFIAITWLCFLLPASLAASRIGITMTTLLTINTMFNSVREHSPQASYAKAIDVWMGACIFFTFLSLFEFTFMAWLEHVKEREEKRKKEHDEEMKMALEKGTELCEKKTNEEGPRFIVISKSDPTNRVKMMDPDQLRRILWIRKFLKKHGLTVLCAAFVLFNAVYWAWICRGSDYFNWTPDPSYNGS